MEIYRAGRYLICKQVLENEIPDLLTLGIKWDSTWQAYTGQYSEELLVKLSELPTATIQPHTAVFLPKKDPLEGLIPIDFDATKREQFMHQKVGTKLLIDNPRYMLAWEMGAGKSNPAVGAATSLIKRGEVDFVLIVTDKNVVRTWAQKHIPHDTDYQVAALEGSKTDRNATLRYARMKKFRFYVTNYDGVKTVLDQLMDMFTEDSIIILDESQRVKDHRTARFRSIYTLVKECEIQRVWALTGTPITQKPEDIYGQYAILDDRIFGPPEKYTNFRAKYVRTAAGNPHVVIGYQNLSDLMGKVHSISHRLTKRDVLDLPPKTHEIIAFDMPTKLAKVYEKFVRTEGLVIRPGEEEPIYTCVHPLTMLAKSRQIPSNWLYLTSNNVLFGDSDEAVSYRETVTIIPEEAEKNEKVDFIISTANDIQNEHGLIVWFAHKADGDLIEKRLMNEKISWVRVDGSTSPNDLQNKINAFQTGQVQIFLGQPMAAGVGIDLTRANTVIYYNNVWSVERRVQSEDRCHRIGTKHPVTYYDLVWQNTSEVTMLNMIKAKQQLSRTLVDKDNIDKMLVGEYVIKQSDKIEGEDWSDNLR